MDKKTILIIEDDEDSRFLLKYYLNEIDYEVIEASDGKEGIQITKSEKPDLILIDIMMPVMDGNTATKIIREDKQFSHIPIIALTANTSDEEKQRSIDAGCNDFIEKPLDLNILTEVIKKHISNLDGVL